MADGNVGVRVPPASTGVPRGTAGLPQSIPHPRRSRRACARQGVADLGAARHRVHGDAAVRGSHARRHVSPIRRDRAKRGSRQCSGPLLDALAALHRLGCYPCDVTPENVVVGDGGPLLFDVGMVRRILARATRAASWSVTPTTRRSSSIRATRRCPRARGPTSMRSPRCCAGPLRGSRPSLPLTRVDSDNMPPLSEATEGYSESFLKGVDLGLGGAPAATPAVDRGIPGSARHSLARIGADLDPDAPDGRRR